MPRIRARGASVTRARTGMHEHPKPTDIILHRASHTLEVAFDDGTRYRLPCEYLRVESPSAEVQGHGPGQRVLVPGKRDVNITAIEPIGNYAVVLHFDDGHDSGILQLEHPAGARPASTTCAGPPIWPSWKREAGRD